MAACTQNDLPGERTSSILSVTTLGLTDAMAKCDGAPSGCVGGPGQCSCSGWRWVRPGPGAPVSASTF